MKNFNHENTYAPYENLWRNLWCTHCRSFLRPLTTKYYTKYTFSSVFEIITDSSDSNRYFETTKQEEDVEMEDPPASEMMGCVSFSHEECFGVCV